MQVTSHTLRVSDLSGQTSGVIWLLNSAHEVIERGGDVSITIQRKDGSGTIISVPKTWVPIEATEYAPFREILDAPKFLDACRNGLVTLITADYAQLLLSQPGADEELARLRQRQEAARAETSNRALGRNVTISGGSGNDDDNTAPVAPIPKRGSQFAGNGQRETSKSVQTNDLFADASVDEVEVAPNFKAWVARLNSQDETEATASIRSRGQLSVDEFKYLHNTIRHEYIKSVLAKKLPT